VHQATRLFVEVAQRSNRTVPSCASAKLAALARQRVRTKDASGIAGRKCLRLEALICHLPELSGCNGLQSKFVASWCLQTMAAHQRFLGSA
jgi:hypothetical protein